MMAMGSTFMLCHLNILPNMIMTQFISPIATHIPTLIVVNIFKIFVAFKIILTSRVHPGESNASYMIKGVIDYLISEDENA